MFELGAFQNSLARARDLPVSLWDVRQQEAFVPRSLTEKMEARGDRKFKILSIDGGGIRGIIPLKVLSALERIIGRLSDTFDLIAGTSTGAIIALSLTASKANLRASDVLNLYETRSHEIFRSNPHRRAHEFVAGMIPRFKAGQEELIRSLIDHPFYTDEGLTQLASEIFGETLMRHTRTNVLIPAVDITHLNAPITKRFTNLTKADAFFAVQDVGLASAAAPTYFPYKHLKGRTYVDGGLSCNNPAEQSHWHARHHNVSLESDHILSLGTGFTDIEGIPDSRQHNRLYWTKKIFPTVNGTLSNTIDANLRGLFGEDRYWRLNPGLTREIDLDDNSPATLAELSNAGDALVEENADRIREIARILQPEAI